MSFFERDPTIWEGAYLQSYRVSKEHLERNRLANQAQQLREAEAYRRDRELQRQQEEAATASEENADDNPEN